MFALRREDHQLISRNDMIPTPSHPTNSSSKLFAVVSVIIESKKIIKYLVNCSKLISADIYQFVNSRIAHEINRAVGRNIIEYWSNSKLILISRCELNQMAFVVIDCKPILIEINIGIILI